MTERLKHDTDTWRMIGGNEELRTRHVWRGGWCTLVKNHDGSWDVRYGDTGYECDPGTEYASTKTAIEEVETAIAELTEILGILKAADITVVTGTVVTPPSELNQGTDPGR